MLQRITDALLSVVYPSQCQICSSIVDRSSDGAACGDCWDKTRIFSGSEVLCDKCGAFLRETKSSAIVSCHQCEDQHYDRARAIGVYHYALSASVIDLKRSPHIPSKIRELLFATLERSSFTDSTLVVPVPLSAKRSVERGFNQAGVIANILAKETNIPFDELSLVRKIHTPMHRVAMDKKARDLTVRNAFEVKRPKLIAGHDILLVDDVFTSGATVSYCAKVLKKNGARKVNVLTLARAV
ncbi:MAG: ComF family protein [Saprospiraceae bacterium]|nr:ComF family protein [Pyrinomonadaceae bacterium]